MEDWNKADKDGTIDVPDYLDGLLNKVGIQILLHRIGKNEVQTICDIVRHAEKFMLEQVEKEKESIRQMLIDDDKKLLAEKI